MELFYETDNLYLLFLLIKINKKYKFEMRTIDTVKIILHLISENSFLDRNLFVR